MNQSSPNKKYLQKSQHYVSFPPSTRATINLLVTFAFTGFLEIIDLAAQLLTHPNSLQWNQVVVLLFVGFVFSVFHAGLTYFGSNATLVQEIEQLEKEVQQDATSGKPLL